LARHQGNVVPVFPFHFSPERAPFIVVRQHEYVTPTDAITAQSRKAPLNQAACNTLSPVPRRNRHVMEEAAASVMSAKNGSDKPIPMPGR
jgi:hypothetical protein